MSEGELKKRFAAVSDVMNMTYDTYPAMYEKKPHLSDINRILDEAKKEFPDYEALIPIHNWDTPSEFSELVRAWFKKWFGSHES